MHLPRVWAWLLALGFILIVLGVITISDVFLATLTSMMVIGWLLVIGGVVQLVHAFGTHGWAGVLLNLLGGVFYLVVGLLLVGHPVAGSLALTLLAAFFLFTMGLFRISAVLVLRMPGWGWTLGAGIVDIILATLITAGWPVTALWVIGLFVGIEMLIGGVSLVMMGLGLRHPPLLVDLSAGERHMPPAA